MLQTFDPKALKIIIAGQPVVGFAETMVAISRPDPMWNSQVGAHGDTMRVKTNNKTTDVVFTLQQSSPSLADLNTLADADESEDSNGVFTIQINYTGGKSVADGGPGPVPLLVTDFAYIEKKPDATWGNTPQDREFTIKCADATYNIGATSQNNHDFGTL